ncbi:TIGR00304 family membrane protein [Methanobacterium subterraneum]|uniref:TIGR00304 family protein n=1 Tax=Methanobacterium subterraneum TaxID=59277 RepID=A0A7K4DL14_9EURY|nr:TIGR00304 family protein [Methanobacterium subterraneum]NMO09048.1 TIGR00304 family protein [Methanobacterium subterraneum]PKL73028.1 MAG: TIGR00304 family protein [Methanobacteriales archaeon HGW-Methanobacteriales-2]
MIKGETIIFMGIAAVILGILLIFIGAAFLSSGKTEDDGDKVSTGGVILIGPIPIVFGNDKNMVSIAVLGAIIIMVLAYIFFYRGSP